MSFQRASLFLAGSQVSVAMYSSGSCARSTDYRPILHNQTALTLKGTFLFEAVGSRLDRSVSTLTARAGIDPSPCLKLSTQNVDSWTAAGGHGCGRNGGPVSPTAPSSNTRARGGLRPTFGESAGSDQLPRAPVRLCSKSGLGARDRPEARTPHHAVGPRDRWESP
jgi:hypothetical protein